MSDEIIQALSLMLIGMLTVFFILLLIYAGGRLVIAIGNRFPEREEDGGLQESAELNVSVISAVVNRITLGKAKKIDITKKE